ncbi:hypothetical protein GOP47_0010566 [Adiantum capillus-veneris]|uniref:Uncharacterized protein n=1 Tax=Adiantum capillus-veneris TaxID=13818 RepID=A0A9D4ZIX2_ADICA|nr:hypothetical protein GOP47_0010566 [Adiantum capillus-veneris]
MAKQTLLLHGAGVLLVLLAVVLSQMVVGGASVEWRMEVENMADGVENGTVNDLWCGVGVEEQGDLDYGPVQGADTSAPDGSYWHLHERKDDYLSSLKMPTLSYGCRLQVQSLKSGPALT